MNFIPTVLESPFAGDVDKNIRYARTCMHDMIVNHNEAPFASHLLYTQEGVLRDEISEERTMGIEAGFAFREICNKSVFYVDLGMSNGMELGKADAEKKGKQVEVRNLPEGLMQLVND